MSPTYVVDPPIVAPSTLSGLVLPYVPDYALVIDETPRVRETVFGDGYSQRSADGLRPILQSWSVKFGGLTKTVKDEIVNFFRAMNGQTSFLFAMPDGAWATTAEAFGTGDGARTAYQLRRLGTHVTGADSYDGAYVNVSVFNAPPSIYKAGTLLATPADYSVDTDGLVTFTTPPAVGAALTFTAAGVDYRRVIAKPWSTNYAAPNAYDITATFKEVMV